jgi:hypothetical protein
MQWLLMVKELVEEMNMEMKIHLQMQVVVLVNTILMLKLCNQFKHL